MDNGLQETAVPDFLCIGFFCHDLHAGIYVLGGTASYASLMAQGLGEQTAVLTSVGPDFLFMEQFERAGVAVVNKPATRTTVFENRYLDGERTQFIYERASTLGLEDLPALWKDVPVVKFCLIAEEVDFELLQSFPKALVGATIQGWLRTWDANGRVSPKSMDWQQLSAVDIAFMSKDDLLGFEGALSHIIQYAGIVIVTKGGDGATVYEDGQPAHYPAFPVQEVDPTGAGDIFATVFLVQYAKSEDIASSTAYAHAAASFVVERLGVYVPSPDEIQQRGKAYQALFF